jgi:hypothetical protein
LQHFESFGRRDVLSVHLRDHTIWVLLRNGDRTANL